MPPLENKSHVKTLAGLKKRPDSADPNWVYGMKWGDPETKPYLQHVVRHFIEPYVNPEHICVEIGPGGGRWTRYLSGFKKIYAVDFHQELLDELARNFSGPNIVPIKNNGDDFPGVPANSVDFLFSYGVFVHLDLDIVENYLEGMRTILKPGAHAFLQYPDKRKPAARENKGFAVNTPGIMRPLVESKGFTVLEEDNERLRHSAMIFFTPK